MFSFKRLERLLILRRSVQCGSASYLLRKIGFHGPLHWSPFVAGKYSLVGYKYATYNPLYF